MKKFYYLYVFLFTFFSIQIIAQTVPNGFSYQSIVRDAVGLPLPNQSVTLRISIRQTSATGTIIYQEQHTKSTNQFGLVNLIVGSGTVAIGTNLNTVNWTADKHFVQVEVFNGSVFVDLGTSEFQTVPYAFGANNTLKIQNTSVSGVAPTANQVLQFNAVSGLWEPTNVSGVSLITQTADVTVSGTTFNIGTASGTSFGLLNPVDYTTFSNKVSSQWITTSTGLDNGIVFNNGNVSIGANTISGAKLKVNGDLSAGGQVIASQTMNPTGGYNITTPTTIFKQRIYIPIGTNDLIASFNAYEFVGTGGSRLQVWIGNVLVGTATLTIGNDQNSTFNITDIPVSAFAGTFQNLEIKALTNASAQGVILQGYTLVIKD